MKKKALIITTIMATFMSIILAIGFNSMANAVNSMIIEDK